MELLIVIGIVAVLSSIVSLGIVNFRKKADMDSVKAQMVSLLNEARSRSVSQEDGESWGVRFVNSSSAPFYALFKATYSASTERGHYRLPTNVSYASSTFPVDTEKEIMFREISGFASGSPSINILQVVYPFTSSTISVSSSGVITY